MKRPAPPEKPKHPFLHIAVPVLLGALLCLFRFGPRILNPADREWLLARDDSATNYLGWLFYRQESWSFPLGRIQDYLAPVGTSVGQTDSLPILALPLKLIAFLLPEPYQYFGGWVLLSYCLQAFFGYLLMRTLTQRFVLVLAGTAFFLFSPVMLIRHVHIALASHWVILAGLWLYFRRSEPFVLRRAVLAWLVMLAVCCGIHPYLAVMVAGLFVAWLARETLLDRRIALPASAAILLAGGAVMLGAWYLAGYLLFQSGSGYGATEFAHTAMNLNALWNSQGHSRFLPALPTGSTNEFEGFNYFGLGLLPIVAWGIYRLTRRALAWPTVRRHLPLAVVLAVLTGLAVSHQVFLGDRQLLAGSIPSGLAPLLNPFRASGRFFWPVYYAIIYLSLYLMLCTPGDRFVKIFLLLCMHLQFVDLSPMLHLRHDYNERRYTSRLQSPAWERVVPPCERILTYPPFMKHTDRDQDFRDLALLAAKYRKPISAGYAARLAGSKVEAFVEEMKEHLLGDRADPRALYILRSAYLAAKFPDLQGRLICTEIDGYKVCCAGEAGCNFERTYSAEGVRLDEYLARVKEQTAIITVKRDATRQLDGPARSVLRDLGSRIDELAPDGSYVCILSAGRILFEQVGNDYAVTLNATRGEALGAARLQHDLEVRSAGKEVGDLASVLVGGRETVFNREGINIVVLNDRQDVREVASFAKPGSSYGQVFRLLPLAENLRGPQ